MSEKVTIPKEIAADIEAIRNKGAYADRYLLSLAFSYTFGKEGRELHYYASENYDTYINAIVNGYTVEKTPEEKVREYYERMSHISKRASYGSERARCVVEGVKKTLNLLEIKIEGVPAEDCEDHSF